MATRHPEEQSLAWAAVYAVPAGHAERFEVGGWWSLHLLKWQLYLTLTVNMQLRLPLQLQHFAGAHVTLMLLGLALAQRQTEEPYLQSCSCQQLAQSRCPCLAQTCRPHLLQRLSCGAWE